MVKLYKNFLAALFCSLSAFNIALADTPAPIDTSGFELSLYTGATNPSINPGELKASNETDSLHPNGRQHSDFTWGLGGAYRYRLPAFPENRLLNTLQAISLGLDLLSFQSVQKGYDWLFDQPAYANYYYTLPITSTRLMIDSQLTFHPIGGQYFYPFIEGGVGVVRNTANYYDSPLVSGTTGLTIASYTQNQFAYTYGGGIKILLPKNLMLSIAYLYANLGNASTAHASSTPLVAPVIIPLASETWLAALTYYF